MRKFPKKEVLKTLQKLPPAQLIEKCVDAEERAFFAREQMIKFHQLFDLLRERRVEVEVELDDMFDELDSEMRKRQ